MNIVSIEKKFTNAEGKEICYKVYYAYLSTIFGGKEFIQLKVVSNDRAQRRAFDSAAMYFDNLNAAKIYLDNLECDNDE